MMRTSVSFAMLPVLGGMLLFTTLAWGQQNASAGMYGSVFDSQGGVIAGVKGIAPPDGSEMILVIVAVSACPNAPIAQAVKRSIA